MNIFSFSNLAFAVLLLCLFPSLHNAHAYLDPGTGSYAIQVGAALFFSGAYVVKLSWRKITTATKKLFSRKSA